MRSLLTHLLTIATVSKLLDYGRKSQNYIHINTYYCNRTHIMMINQHFSVLCPQLIRNVRTRRCIDSSSIIAHLVIFDIPRER